MCDSLYRKVQWETGIIFLQIDKRWREKSIFWRETNISTVIQLAMYIAIEIALYIINTLLAFKINIFNLFPVCSLFTAYILTYSILTARLVKIISIPPDWWKCECVTILTLISRQNNNRSIKGIIRYQLKLKKRKKNRPWHIYLWLTELADYQRPDKQHIYNRWPAPFTNNSKWIIN